MSTHRRLLMWVAVGGASAALAAALVGGGATAGATGSSYAATADCQEHQGFVDGDSAAVAALLPKRYSPVTDPSSGRPLVFVRAERCRQITLDGRSGPATMASFGVVVNSPDGRGCASSAPALGAIHGDVPPVCNWYTLSWLSDDRRIVDWLRSGTPGFPATYVPHLAFDLGSFDPSRGGAPFHFQAAAPAPSPFTMDDVGRERPGPLSIRGGYWVDSGPNTVKVAFSTEDLTSGDATGTARAAPGSQLAKLFGAPERPYLPGYSVVAAERWTTASYRKQVLGPASSDRQLDSFAGSCSLQGTVSFTPPATNNDTPLAYSYDAEGTCTGTLDGQAVSNAPVKLHHSGAARGTCSRAHTTAPGEGTIAFAGGPVIAYTLDFSSMGTAVNFDFYGARSGTAEGQGNFLTQRTSPDILLQCAGKGASQAALDLSLTTDSPLVSERAVAPSASPGVPSNNAGSVKPRLRLAARPRRARVGRRTRFVFRVAAPGGRPISGTVVRFAGQHARARRSGMVTMVAALHRPGRWTARASKLGFRQTHTSIWVRRR